MLNRVIMINWLFVKNCCLVVDAKISIPSSPSRRPACWDIGVSVWWPSRAVPSTPHIISCNCQISVPPKMNALQHWKRAQHATISAVTGPKKCFNDWHRRNPKAHLRILTFNMTIKSHRCIIGKIHHHEPLVENIHYQWNQHNWLICCAVLQWKTSRRALCLLGNYSSMYKDVNVSIPPVKYPNQPRSSPSLTMKSSYSISCSSPIMERAFKPGSLFLIRCRRALLRAQDVISFSLTLAASASYW